MNEARYARHLVLPEVGREGQQRLARSKALIVGLGGLGCPAAQLLAASGLGTLWLNDFDTVDISNLPRQILYAARDAGRAKTQVAAERLSAMNDEVSFELINRRLSSVDEFASLIENVDVVLDGTDNFAARFAVSDACVRTRTPLVSGAAIRLEGQIVVFQNDGRGPCYRCIYSEDDEWLGDCQGNGVLAPVTGVIGSMMALEAIRVLLEMPGSEDSVLRLWDARSGEWNRVAVRRNPNCSYCA